MVYEDKPYHLGKEKLNSVSDGVYLMCGMKACPERIKGNRMK